MKNTVTQTKLFIPLPRMESVSRPRLVAKLNAGLHKKLTIISAPAGYGKTTLLSEWISSQLIKFGWVSLDVSDNDPGRFFSYITASLATIGIPAQESLLAILERQPDESAEFLQALINQIAISGIAFALVLDDYHRIDNINIHNCMTALLENLPPNMRLVIATRSDPPLHLAKLRARGDLCELRVDDLRFSTQEALQFFNQSMQLGLSDSQVSILTGKTEGWITGLQLAGISLQDHPDRYQFVTTFAGDHHFIADYLLDEALNRQPPAIQNFLVQTSILERLCAPLCDALLELNGSQIILDMLYRDNLFLNPLDNRHNWYRYHHLFSDLLQKRLLVSTPEKPALLHKKASRWYQQNNLLPDAVNHALAANDIEQIASLAEEMAVYKMDSKELQSLIDWINRQPEAVLVDHPWLLIARAWCLFNCGKYEKVQETLVEIENILAAQSTPQELAGRIRGHAAVIRSYLAEILAEVDTAIGQAQEALQLLTEKDVQLRAFVNIRWANSLAWTGRFREAIQALEEAGQAALQAGDGHIAISALSEQAALQRITGQLNLAYENMLKIKEYAETLAQKEGRRLPAMGQLYRQLSNILTERNQLEEAAYFAAEAVNICKLWGERESQFATLFTLARVHFYLGETEKFEKLSAESMQIAQLISADSAAHIARMKNHLLLQRGLNPINEESIIYPEHPVTEPFSHARRLNYLICARYLLAKGKYEKALSFVRVVLEMVAAVQANFYIIRYHVLEAKILVLMGKPEEGLNALTAALDLAAPEGYVRSFLDEGEEVAQLLYQAAQSDIHAPFCLRLLDEFAKEAVQTSSANQALVEPLSQREIDVLALIAQGCSNQEIAHKLYLSLFTIKSHARNIYSKLGVKNRTEAVAKARIVGLLAKE